MNLMNSKDLAANLRLTNLEKQFRKQDQKISEKLKSLTKDKEAQKNFIGS
jgi:hypothetical protein